MLATQLLGLVIAATTAFAGCSSLPPTTRPPFADHDVELRYVVPPDGCLFLPVTAGDVVLQRLTIEPAPLGERSWSGGRQLRFTPGTAVTVCATLRSYGSDQRAPRSVSELFPGSLPFPTSTP
jgi:hypothetical protein